MYYNGANWKWGDEMNLRFIERDGKKILQQEVLEEYGSHWEDVPCVVEKKEERKMWQVINTMDQLSSAHPTGEVYWHQLASAAIDAVIECYSQWSKINSGPTLKSFPEYLKENLL